MKIEDIREIQAEKAERHIREQFKMERIVYCQDDLYLGDLNTAKAENSPKAAAGIDLQFPATVEPSAVGDMVSRTNAYFYVSSQAVIQQICCPLNATADLAGVNRAFYAIIPLCREYPGTAQLLCKLLGAADQ